MDATSRVVQAVQAKSYCVSVSMFSEWKRGNRDYNRETPVPPVPVNETRNGDTANGDPRYKRTPAEPVPPPSSIPPDWVAIPLEQYIVDALYRGTLTGQVPPRWSRDGWVMSLRDRTHRTDDKEMRARLQAEIDAVEGEADRLTR